MVINFTNINKMHWLHKSLLIQLPYDHGHEGTSLQYSITMTTKVSMTTKVYLRKKIMRETV
jgi:hypothetical protein